MISRIRIQNFRSLIDVDVNLEPLTVLIGRSGTGKSNFVGAIRALRGSLLGQYGFGNARDTPLGRPAFPAGFRVVFRANGKSASYAYELGYRLSAAFESLVADNQTLFAQEHAKWITPPDIHPIPPAGQPALGSMTGIRVATIAHNILSRGIGCYDFPSEVLRGQHQQHLHGGYWDDGQNPLPVASGIQDDIDHLDDWAALTETMASLNPSVRSIDLTLPHRNQLQVGYRVGEKTMLMDVASESEGFRRYLATLLALYQTPAKQTLIFEHPENGIHPGALETLANEFKRHVRQGRGQIILTTHSPQLLDHFEPEQIRVVDIENQQTHIGPLAHEQMEALRERLLKPGELLTVDPARLEGQLAEVPA